MNNIEAMKLALEALENSMEAGGQKLRVDKAITALCQAIEQADKQKPYGYFRYDIQLDAWVQNREKNIGVAFYTAPPQREWQGLTDEEVSAAVDDCDVYFDDEFLVEFARRIEAKLKEKNNG